MLAGCSTLAPTDSSKFITAFNYPVNIDDHLALLSPHYKVSEVAAKHRAGEGIGILDWTFGESLDNLYKFVRNASVSFVRIHLINNTCIRNRSCGAYEVGYGYTLESFNQALLNRDPKIINFLINRTKLYRTFSDTFPTLGIAISPILEGNESDAAYEVAADTVLRVWPTVQIANSLMSNNGKRYRGAWRECHGNNLNADCDIISTDGQEIMDIDSLKYIQQPAGRFLKARWSRTDNCRDQGPLAEPRKRTNCTTGRESEQINHSTDSVPPAPKRTFTCSNEKDKNGNDVFTTKNIWKPLSEDKGTGDPRANLPVLIPAGMQHRNTDLVTYRNQKVGVLAYYGKYTDGRPRIYSGQAGGSKLTGYEFQKKSVSLSNSPWVWAKQGSVCRGPFVPGRRAGNFR